MQQALQATTGIRKLLHQQDTMLALVSTASVLASVQPPFPLQNARPAVHVRSHAPTMQFMSKGMPAHKSNYQYDALTTATSRPLDLSPHAVKEINEGNKMKVMKKGVKPKVGPKRMPAEVLELTQKFKKQYDSKDLNQLWGAMIACYGTEKLAIQAAYENPQIVNPSVSIAAIACVHRRRRVGALMGRGLLPQI